MDWLLYVVFWTVVGGSDSLEVCSFEPSKYQIDYKYCLEPAHMVEKTTKWEYYRHFYSQSQAERFISDYEKHEADIKSVGGKYISKGFRIEQLPVAYKVYIDSPDRGAVLIRKYE